MKPLKEQMKQWKKAQDSIELIAITKSIADEFLGDNWDLNRDLKSAAIHRFCRDMKEGRWYPNADVIIFIEVTVKGRKQLILFNGQNRLKAASLADIPEGVPMFVSKGGYPSESVEILDSGTTRSLADRMKIGGLANTLVTEQASVLKKIHAREYRVDEKPKLTADIPDSDYIKLFKGLDAKLMEDSVKFGKICANKFPYGSTANWAFSLWDLRLFINNELTGPEQTKADKDLEYFSEELESTSPQKILQIHELSNFMLGQLQHSKSGKSGVPQARPVPFAAAIRKTWINFRNDDVKRIYSFRDSNPNRNKYPTLV